MRDLTSDEINDLLNKCDWGTLLLVDGDKPYGIEVSHYVDSGKLFFIFNPGGKAAQCIENDQNVAYKVCQADLARLPSVLKTIRMLPTKFARQICQTKNGLLLPLKGE
jgi:nitroimidazol reductase NimA-like FMN-containing flavoprotein (pyridoxamine 5'-phosphate oxidase superfamily)